MLSWRHLNRAWRTNCVPYSWNSEMATTKLQQGESSDHKEIPLEKEEQAMDSVQPCMRVDFCRCEERDSTGWLSCVKCYFHYYQKPEASIVDITAIHLKGDAIQWYNWLEYTQEVST
ncbi:hypothetical protein GW17_00061288 [Ensete ventricosum]|nr:hypothetical protein GW17_00061288 [Ensete ventricosum]